MTTYALPPDLLLINQLIYQPTNVQFTSFRLHQEGTAYSACAFQLDGKMVEFRISKITPKKRGQFVAIWQRDPNGETAPFNSTDALDYIIICCRKGQQLGQFVFPKAVLIQKGIIRSNGKAGKRGMRVYPPWDVVTSLQAVKTQEWQTEYFSRVVE